MTTPATPLTLEERVTILETRLETVLPTLATKEDIARLEGKIDTGNERLDAKIDAVENKMLIKLTGIAIALMGIGIAIVKYL